MIRNMLCECAKKYICFCDEKERKGKSPMIVLHDLNYQAFQVSLLEFDPSSLVLWHYERANCPLTFQTENETERKRKPMMHQILNIMKAFMDFNIIRSSSVMQTKTPNSFFFQVRFGNPIKSIHIYHKNAKRPPVGGNVMPLSINDLEWEWVNEYN